MESFTIVLVVCWVLLMSTFATMYVLDEKVKAARKNGNQA